MLVGLAQDVQDVLTSTVATGQGMLRQRYIARPKAYAFGRTWRFLVEVHLKGHFRISRRGKNFG
ncbi:hypothetical protein NCCP133_20740 [Cytobacillus sp. NCCP-133]|nr:hypothetical protein NCCP133_20740 [Cytobacillus sp. NCCP-133]